MSTAAKKAAGNKPTAGAESPKAATSRPAPVAVAKEVKPVEEVKPVPDVAPVVEAVLMSGYGGTGRATLLRDNQQVFLFQQAATAAGKASMAVQLERINRSSYPWGVSFEIFFTDINGNPADPGVFEIDIQTADIDQDIHYCTINALNAAGQLNANFVGRIELPNFYAKYVRAYAKTLTNAVYTSVLVTR
jgi:hypothetical protein